MRIYIKTYGCTANQADSLRMKQLLISQGHILVEDVDFADVVVVNTCTVTRTTQRKVMKYIQPLTKSSKHIIVAGCLPSAQPDVLEGIDCQLITPSSLDDIIKITGNGSAAVENSCPPVLEGMIGIIGISQGCVGDCSYCIVKQARGDIVSRTVQSIVKETESLLQQGAKEIQLTSQDIAAYGLDTTNRLPELLNAICSIDGDYMIRIGMMNPFTLLDILDDVIEVFQDHHIYKFLHLPVQSGSDQILSHMNRKYTIEDFKYIVHKFKAKFPELTLSTDFIIGYPIETEQDFNDTLKLLHEIKPQKVNITRYSTRPGTRASLLYDMPGWKKKDRSRLITKHHHIINDILFKKKIRKHVRILTTEAGKNNSTIGRDIFYQNIVVQEELQLGKWYDVMITNSTITYLIGEPVATSI